MNYLFILLFEKKLDKKSVTKEVNENKNIYIFQITMK